MDTEKSRVQIMLDSLIKQHEEEENSNCYTTAANEDKRKTNLREEEEKPTIDDDDRMSKLAPDVVIEILCKLPIKSLIHWRCVCKAWRDLILDPRFARLHHSTREPSTVVVFHFKGERKRSIYLMEPEAACDGDAITKVENPNLGITIVGSCDGLLCSCDDLSREYFYVSNPVTGERMTLPKIKTDPKHLSVSGFGFSSKTNQYKVIRMSWICNPSGKPKLKVEICTVGNRSWRKIDNAPYYTFPYGLSGIFLNEALHWIAWDDLCSTLIFAFQIGNEQFITIPLPPVSLSERGKAICWANLGEVEGCLYILAVEAAFPPWVELWVMDDYGVEESWRIGAVIQDPSWMWCNGNIWFQFVPDSENELWITDHGNRWGEVFPLTASFLPLEDIVMGTSSKVSNAHSK
ncbi:hypothetical protein L1049_024074 [Liquidambar formosana]|uniref:F-box domain-containing protein n=1 Tax=Liquidambar formosana TaxID=63359 RepID=A0AAP0RVC9_LIQFO